MHLAESFSWSDTNQLNGSYQFKFLRSRRKVNHYKGLWTLGEEGILKVGSAKSIKETIWECSGAFSYLTSMTKSLSTSCSVPCFSEICFSLWAKKVGKKIVLSSPLMNNSKEFHKLQRLLKFSKLLLSRRNIGEPMALMFLHKHPKFWLRKVPIHSAI